MKKTYLTWQDVESHCSALVEQMQKIGWNPTVVVGLTRGGLLPGKMISHYLNVDMCALDVSLRDNHFAGPTSTWIPEEIANGHRILIVDDINDTGATFEWIRKDWALSTKWLKPQAAGWPWSNIKFAALVHNSNSTQPTDFSAMTINKALDPQWICFPWELWFQNKSKNH